MAADQRGMHMRSGDLRDEDGWVLVTALTLMTILAVFAAGTLALSTSASRTSSAGRARETAFQLAESALNAQTFALTGSWPGSGGAASAAVRYPATCTPASTDTRCPTVATMSQLKTGIDNVAGASWTTSVRDNSGMTGAERFWNEGMISASPAYDANGDGQLWVRAQGVAAGRTRTLVALVRVEPQAEALPHATLIAGRLEISNMGRKTIIDAAGSSATTGAVAVRCTPQAGESTACLGHPLGTSANAQSSLKSLLDVQISPNVSTTGYAQGASLTADALERLRQTAISNGTYFTTCPASLAGAVVFLAVPGTCSYTGNSVFNSAASPGVVLLSSGSLYLGGTVALHGVVYHANTAGSAATDLVQVQGNAEVDGGVIVDGPGGVVAGSSKLNINYDDRAFDGVRSHGNAGLTQNTWREVRRG